MLFWIFFLIFTQIHNSIDVFFSCRDDTRSLVSTEDQHPPSSRAVNLALQQRVLESLFSIPDYPKHEPNHMNWKKAVQQVESFGQGLEYRCGVTEPLLNARNGIFIYVIFGTQSSIV